MTRKLGVQFYDSVADRCSSSLGDRVYQLVSSKNDCISIVDNLFMIEL